MTSTNHSPAPAQPPRAKRGGAGRPPLDHQQRRVHSVNVYFTPAEFAYLQMQVKAAAMTAPQYLRRVGLESSVPVGVVPDEYRSAWAALARVGGNLNQLSHHLNQLALQGELFSGYKPIIEKLVLELPALRTHVDELRRILLKRAGHEIEG